MAGSRSARPRSLSPGLPSLSSSSIRTTNRAMGAEQWSIQWRRKVQSRTGLEDSKSRLISVLFLSMVLCPDGTRSESIEKKSHVGKVSLLSRYPPLSPVVALRDMFTNNSSHRWSRLRLAILARSLWSLHFWCTRYFSLIKFSLFSVDATYGVVDKIIKIILACFCVHRPAGGGLSYVTKTNHSFPY